MALLLSVAVASDAATSTLPIRAAHQDRDGRGLKLMEETMRVMTIGELLCLTKAEILAIRGHLREQLTSLPYGSVEHREVVETLSNIEIVLARPELQPRNSGSSPAL